MTEFTKDEFIAECQFAKVVATAEGPAILVAGIVFEVYPGEITAPGAEPQLYTEWLVSALRASRNINDPMNAQGMTSGSVTSKLS